MTQTDRVRIQFGIQSLVACESRTEQNFFTLGKLRTT